MVITCGACRACEYEQALSCAVTSVIREKERGREKGERIEEMREVRERKQETEKGERKESERQ